MTTAEKIAQCALKWAAAERAKKLAAEAKSEACLSCIDKDNGPVFERIRVVEYPFVTMEWVYADWTLKAGEDCTVDEYWINQNRAWLEYKAAVKYAGICRAALTRMCNKVNAEGCT